MLMAGCLNDAGHEVDILLGARSEADLIDLDKYAENGTVHTTTEDGTHGVRGFVTNHPILCKDITSFDMVYCCGPEPMMKAVARIAWQNNVACEVSLENTMACGYGVCLCCVTDTIDGHRCVCTEGPVFDIKQLKWHN
jgi:dihydroorotate dehydrogenase electron transfer subunit